MKIQRQQSRWTCVIAPLGIAERIAALRKRLEEPVDCSERLAGSLGNLGGRHWTMCREQAFQYIQGF